MTCIIAVNRPISVGSVPCEDKEPGKKNPLVPVGSVTTEQIVLPPKFILSSPSTT